MSKLCPDCKQEKPLSEFYKSKSHKDGLHYCCKQCNTIRTRKYKRTNKEKVLAQARKSDYARRDKAWAYRIKRIYGITPEQYNDLLEKQNHRCAICSKEAKNLKQRLNIDHDHVTGEIRGLLCSDCNHRLIGRRRDADLFESASRYLRQGTGWFVPTEFLKGVKKKRRKRKKK
jgi:hypothetical protein